ncbi:MAG: 1-deoxy-D-xylulose-5-phosphate synthase [Candidatus Thermoplasmatota archaeon]|nr:1-deoxy-D-xylulose-5-phosphate synthase [Candidatus Thermoplasmatota archaeon]
MRTAFVNELENIMDKDENTFLLTGDLGFSVFERLRERWSKQYINMGVAEQNMIGVAAGMALTGKQVFVYSIIPFVVYRPFEQIRNDVCYQNLPVRLVGVGAGFSYSDAGFTHHAIEDYGILRSFPNLTILSPADSLEVTAQMKQINSLGGPSYMRLGRNGEPILHDKQKFLKIGKALELTRGDDILFVATGSILGKAITIGKLLESVGYTVTILDYHTIKPFDDESLLKSLDGKRLVVTFEEHLVTTGLYSLVAQTILSNDLSIRIIPFGIGESAIHYSGTREYMLTQYGVSDQLIYEKIKKALG